MIMNTNVIKSSMLYTDTLMLSMPYTVYVMLTVYALYIDGSN